MLGAILTNLVILTGLLVVLIIIAATYFSFQREDRDRISLAESLASGMNQPPSLHPIIDLETCIGSGSCLDACPEAVIGRFEGITQLIQAGDCIGHGRCHASCPVGAIALVFGTAERGVDLPLLRPGYESNVDGVFIVGELGGMGLIRNAMSQGIEAVRRGVSASLKGLPKDDDIKDVIIVGAGPAGIATALGCVDSKRSFTLLEQFTLGGSVTHYPRRKLVFTEQIKLPIVGKFGKSEMLKEELVAEFERVCLAAGIEIAEGRRVSAVEGALGRFEVITKLEDGSQEVHRGRTVVLSIGRRGTPRKLNVPGEDLPHVVYRLVDAEQYRRRKVLCVGGGDSCIEAAVSVATMAGTDVHLSYRGDSFFRLKKKNRADLEKAVEKGKITLHLETNVSKITPTEVTLRNKEGIPRTLEIDDIIVNIGGVLPTPFLESIGIEVETKHGDVAMAPKHGKFASTSARRALERQSKRFGRAASEPTLDPVPGRQDDEGRPPRAPQ